MLAIIFAVVFLLVALLALVLEKAYFYLPHKELKRRAARSDDMASALFPAAAYRTDLKVALFTVTALSAAGGLVLFVLNVPSFLGFAGVGLLLLAGFVMTAISQPNTVTLRLAVWCTPVLVRVLRFVRPVIRHVSPFIPAGPAHTGMFEREDLYEFIERQKQQGDSRISHEDLERMRCVLYVSEYVVRDIVVPQRNVKAVNIDDDINPVLLNELHATGHPRFPVYEGKATNVVGTLAIDSVADVKHHGKVRDNCDHHLAFVNEEDSLEQALRAFYETRQHLFIVVNNQNEYVGIITLSDILFRVFGTVDHHAFGHSDDRKAVASRYEHKPADDATQESASEKSTEVIE